MAADEREAHVCGHAIRLVDDPSCLHSSSCGDGAKPVNVVLDDEQASRNGHGCQEVMVLGNSRRRFGILVQARREPDIFAYDLACCLDVRARVLLLITNAPALQTQISGREQDARLLCWRRQSLLTAAPPDPDS